MWALRTSFEFLSSVDDLRDLKRSSGPLWGPAAAVIPNETHNHTACDYLGIYEYLRR